MVKVLTKSVAVVQEREMVYKAVVHTVFLYGSDRWVVTGMMLTVLEVFHHRVARKIAGKTAQCPGDGGWEWPPVEEDLDLAGIYLIKEYIQRRQATIAACMANRSIYKLCTGAEKFLDPEDS